MLRLPWLFGVRCQVSGGMQPRVKDSTYECILCNDSEFLIFIDLKILYVHIIAMGHHVSS